MQLIPDLIAVLKGIFENLAALLALVALVGLVRARLLKRRRRVPAWVVGTLFGLVAAFTMTFPLHVAEGVMVDCRFGVVGLAGVIAGPMSAVAAGVIASAFRYYVGGPVAIGGVFSILTAASLGALFYRRHRWRGEPLTRSHINRFSIELALVLVLLVNTAGLATLGWGRFWELVAHLPVIAGIVIVTVQLLGRLTLFDRERVATAEALIQNQRQLETILNSIAEAVIACDARGQVTHINHLAAELTGVPRRAAVGQQLRTVWRALDEATGGAIPDPVARALHEGRVASVGESVVLESADGRHRRVAYSAAPIRERDEEAEGVVVVFRDVTDELALQRQVRQTQKMESIGQLAGGVAHDFNNLLAVVLGNVELLRLKLAKGEAGHPALLGRIEDAAQRGSGIAKQLLTFSRQGKAEQGPVSVHEVIEEVIALAGHTLDRRIQIQTELNAPDDVIVGDADQIEQALLNLTLNARDAMAERGGVLTFSTSAQAADSLTPKAGLRPGPHLQITVRDTGEGIAPDHLEKIFDPFFTTKDVGKGTGLGLATAYGTVKSHGGHIEVSSELGVGTEFCLLLPIAGPVRTSQPNPPPAEVVRGEGTVLVVDDEPEVRRVLESSLRALGYRTMAREDGKGGLAEYREANTDIDLVILDLNMPEMNGFDCLAAMKEVRPDVKALFVTGHGQPELLDQMRQRGAVGVLRKPFTLPNLSEAVANALASAN